MKERIHLLVNEEKQTIVLTLLKQCMFNFLFGTSDVKVNTSWAIRKQYKFSYMPAASQVIF